MFFRVAAILASQLVFVGPARADLVPYDIVYVRQPRYGNNTNTKWPEVFHPASIDPGADLMLLHPDLLPAGTPYGLVGSSSVYKCESFPGWFSGGTGSFDGLDAFNTTQNGQSPNWGTQGSDAGLYDNREIWAVRLLAMEPGTHRSYGPNGGPSGGPLFRSHAMERLRILGEIPLRKTDGSGQPLLDSDGNPDTSFLVRIPADTPFTF